MTQKLQKIAILVSAFALIAGSTAYAGSYDEYIKEAEAIEGAVPKFDDAGNLRAILMYGEGTFLTAKRSLISKARRKAELKAKRAFSAWMEENLGSETLATDMMEQEEVTDQDGNTQGSVRELETQINIMRSDTKSVLSGLVKLDECVDKNEKIVLVQLGWKPSLSAAAKDAKQIIQSRSNLNRPPSSSANNGAASSASNGTRNSSANESDRGKSLPGVNVIVVKVEGNGVDLRRATNDGLRSAISQVFGEQFASETKTLDLTTTIEVSSMSASEGTAIETSSSISALSSKTKGLIKSYRYLSKNDASTGFKVFLEVSLAKYETGIDPDKVRAIVLHPKLSPSLRGIRGDMDVFNGAVQDTIESMLNQARKITVLDRSFVKEQMKELNRISSGNSPISDLARLGNTAGADIMIVSEIIAFNQELEQKQLGTQVIKRTVFNAEISVKVINVATTNILLSQRFRFRKLRIRAPNPSSSFGQKVGIRLAKRIANKLGGGLPTGVSVDSSSRVDVDTSVRRANKSYDKVKEGVKNDW